MAATSPLYYVGGLVQLFGSTTPPTGFQAQEVPKMMVQVSFAVADTQALLTHNWGLGASGPGFGDPEVICMPVVGPVGGGTSMPFFSYDLTNTNVVKVNKLGVAGTDGTYNFVLRRPHSIGG